MTDSQILIGFPVPLSSVYGVEALDQARSAQIAVDEFNEGGGLNGRMASLVIRDTQHNLDLAKQLTAEMIQQSKVAFVIGALSATEMVAIGKICSEAGLVYNGISIGDGIVSKETRTQFTFHEGPTAFGTADTVGRYAFSHFGFRVATMSVNHPFGLDSLRGLHQVGNAVGVDFVIDEFHALGEKDMRQALLNIQKAKPEVLVSTNFGADQVTMLSQIKELGLDREMRIVCTNVSLSMRHKEGADLYSGVIGGTGYYWRIEEQYTSAYQFNRKYQERWTMPPAAHGSYAYGATKALLAAVQKCNSLRSEQIIEGLLGLRFDFCRGPQFYRHLDHQSVQPVVIVESKEVQEMEHEHDTFKVHAIHEFVGERAFHISYEKS